MEYAVKIIENKAMLPSCPVFEINHFNWGGDYRPKAYGQFAYLEGKGFVLHMTCEEADPVCTYRNNNDPVYLDSAMEAFLSFDPDSRNYFNLEINSAGAVLAKFGDKRSGRTFFAEEQIKSLSCKSSRNKDSWSLDLTVPLSLIAQFFQKSTFCEGDIVRLNFFKIAEGDTLTHFASFAPIQSEKPDFHLPEFFAEGRLTKQGK